MDYMQAMEYLRSFWYGVGVRSDLTRIKRLLEMLDNPHKDLKYVHVAGTNGKGSTTSYISNVLIEAGYKTGVFTSPHIKRFNERIRINHNEILDEDIARFVTIIKEKVDILTVEEGFLLPTEFELLTVMAFMYYKEQNCDIVVLEVGIGGLTDSTNAIENSLVSVICTIGYDHMKYLGTTLEEIAEQKGGIIKENGTVVVYPQPKPIMDVFERLAKEKKATLQKLNTDIIEIITEDITHQEFNFEDYSGIRIKLLGEHQVKNASLALKAIKVLIEKGFKITVAHIKSGFLNTRWAGRFEIVHKNPYVVIDGAHNEDAALTLYKNIKKYFDGKKITFIVGVVSDKDYEKVFGPFFGLAHRFFVISPNVGRAVSVAELTEFLSKHHDYVEGFDSVEEALEFAIDTTMEDEVICSFGSLYYVGNVRDFFGL